MRRRAVRRFTRRRKSKYTWLPVLGEAVADTINGTRENDSIGGDILTFIPASIGTAGEVVNVIIRPLIFDTPVETSQAGINAATALGDFVTNEYFIKRIVGKLFLEYRTPTTTTSGLIVIPAAKVTAGFFVARADDDAVGAGDPIGAQTVPQRLLNYNPENPSTAREPWIWRRSYILSCPPVALDGSATRDHMVISGGLTFPSTNVLYGSALDGPHIDAKTARRVRQDDRLYFAMATRAWPIGQTLGDMQEVFVDGHLEVRVLGALRKARNSGAF